MGSSAWANRLTVRLTTVRRKRSRGVVSMVARRTGAVASVSDPSPCAGGASPAQLRLGSPFPVARRAAGRCALVVPGVELGQRCLEVALRADALPERRERPARRSRCRWSWSGSCRAGSQVMLLSIVSTRSRASAMRSVSGSTSHRMPLRYERMAGLLQRRDHARCGRLPVPPQVHVEGCRRRRHPPGGRGTRPDGCRPRCGRPGRPAAPAPTRPTRVSCPLL